MTRLSSRRRWGILVQRLAFGAVIGAGFGAVVGGLVLKPLLLGVALGALSGAVNISVGMAIISGAGIFLPHTRIGRALGRTLGRMPFLAVVAVKAALYMAVVVAVFGSRLGARLSLVVLAIDADRARSIIERAEVAMPLELQITIATLVVFLLVLLRQAALLVGEHNLRNVVLGRYRQPRTEERFFLFVDIVGSTPVAERLGPLMVHRYLDQIFQLASDPIDDHGGEVTTYVGDEIIVTWTVPEGSVEARPLACFFAIETALAAVAKDFEREFGTVPKLRAALHAGEVVTGETGGSRRAIVFNGDVMNTTSRIENATRALGRPFLVSEDALRRLDGAGGYALEDMGLQQLRGRQAALRVYAAAPLPRR